MTDEASKTRQTWLALFLMLVVLIPTANWICDVVPRLLSSVEVGVRLLKPTTKSLFLGSSRAHRAINPQLLPGSPVLIAAPYLTYDIAEQILIRYTSDSRPAKVFLESSIEMFKLSMLKMVGNDPLVLAHMGIPANPKFADWLYDLPGTFRQNFPYIFTAKITYGRLLNWKKTVEDNNVHFARLNHAPSVSKYDSKQDESTKSKIEFLIDHADGESFSSNSTALQRIALLARTRGFDLVLLSFPLRQAHYDHIPPTWHRDYKHATKTIMEGYPEVSLISTTDLTSWVDDDFMDSDHLNSSGAAKLASNLVKLNVMRY